MRTIQESKTALINESVVVKASKSTINDTNKKLGLVTENNTLNLADLTTILCSHSLSDLPYITGNVTEAFTTRNIANGLSVVDGSYAEIESIVGDTIKCDNLFDPTLFTDISIYPDNKYVTIDNDGTININNTSSATIYLSTKFIDIETASYYFKKFDVNISDYAIFIQTNGSRSYANILNEPKSVSVTNSFAFTIRVGANKSGTLKIMVAKNSTDATTYQPYFTGLKNSKLTSLVSKNANGETIDTITPNLELGKWQGIYKASNVLNFPTLETTHNGIIWNISNNGIIINGTSTNSFVDLTDLVIHAGTYTINLFNTLINTNVRFDFCKVSNNERIDPLILANAVNKTAQIVITEDVYIKLRVLSGGVVNNFTFKPMLVSGSTTPTMYLPYTDKNYIEDKQSGLIDLSSLDWVYEQTNNRFRASISNFIGGNQRGQLLLCDKYECKYNSEGFNIGWDMVIYNESSKNIHIHDHRFTEPLDLKNSLMGNMLCYQTETHTYTPLDINLQYKVTHDGTETIVNENDIYNALTTTNIKYIVNNIPQAIIEEGE